MTPSVKPARLIPWEHGRIGVEIELEDGSSHAREVDASGLWKDISTAPKDGTPFLAYWLRTHSGGERYEAAQPYVVAHFMAGRLFPSWIDEEDQPTHWQPLPAPPAPQKQEGRG